MAAPWPACPSIRAFLECSSKPARKAAWVPVVIIAAALSIQDVRERPLDKAALADQAHRQFVDPLSDFVTVLNIWHAIHDGSSRPGSMNELKKFCRQHFLSFRRIREWRDIHGQIKAVLKEQRFGPWKATGRPLRICRRAVQATTGRSIPCMPPFTAAILSGFLSNIAMKKEKVFFRAAKDREVMLFPGSGLFKNPGNWIVAAEMVETSRLFARKAATIDVTWLEPLGGDLCRRSWSDPHWERSREEVVAREQVTLFGLPIVQDRRVAFGRIDPQQASDIFVRSALVDGDVKQPLDFMRTMPNGWKRCAAWRTAFGGGTSSWTTRCWWRSTRNGFPACATCGP
jgi:ATP-dependent helicase HrpA